MCYSATASFSASAVLAVMGLVLNVRVRNKNFLPLALIPLLFAAQQAAEGFLWLGIAPNFAKNLFLFVAFVGWPLWIPFAFWFAEEVLWSKQTLAICFGIGLVVSTMLGFTIPGMMSSTNGSSIHYTYPSYFDKHSILFVGYAIATVFPFFLSSLPKTSYLGLLFAASALLIGWIDRTFFISLWCFVSALISLGLFFILKPYLYTTHSKK
jgi:hypothetical protein